MKPLRLALLATVVVASLAGCNERHEGTGTNDGMKTSSYRPFQYGTGNMDDMRLGLDRYRGTDPDLIRDSDSMRRGLSRDNGWDGYDQDGVNRWSDYRRTGPGGAPNGSGMMDGTHNNTRMEAAQSIADQLTGINPVESCNVLLTDNNAYVAVKTRDGQSLDELGAVKKQIADKVQQLRPETKNVYVSANPDFMSRVNGYMQDIDAGKPVSGFIGQFNEMVQRLFPAEASGAEPRPVAPNAGM